MKHGVDGCRPRRLNSTGFFEPSPTGNNEDSASFITTCSSIPTLTIRTSSSGLCLQKEEGRPTISLSSQLLGRLATRGPFQPLISRPFSVSSPPPPSSTPLSRSFRLYRARRAPPRYPRPGTLTNARLRAKCSPTGACNLCISLRAANPCAASDPRRLLTFLFYYTSA